MKKFANVKNQQKRCGYDGEEVNKSALDLSIAKGIGFNSKVCANIYLEGKNFEQKPMFITFLAIQQLLFGE